MEWACEGGGCLSALPISQDGTETPMEYFRDALQWHLDIPLKDPPMTCDGCRKPFTVDHA